MPTTVVGSYPQPDWLVDRQLLSKGVARVRLDLWRVAEPWLEQAQDDATLLAIRDMERAGIDIITDGEMRRESYSNRFATSLEGIASGKPGEVVSKAGLATAVPRVVGPIRRTHAVETRDMAFLRENTERMAKITLPGPFTMSRQAVNEYYKDDDEMVMDFAAAVNAEARDLEKAGADVIQLDEPWLRQDPPAAKRIAVKAIDRALEGLKVDDGGASLFRLRRGRQGREARRLFVSRRTRRLQGGPDLDRGGAAETRSRRAQRSRAEEDHAGRDRSRRTRRGDAGHRGDAHSCGAEISYPPIASCPRRIAA